MFLFKLLITYSYLNYEHLQSLIKIDETLFGYLHLYARMRSFFSCFLMKKNNRKSQRFPLCVPSIPDTENAAVIMAVHLSVPSVF